VLQNFICLFKNVRLYWIKLAFYPNFDKTSSVDKHGIYKGFYHMPNFVIFDIKSYFITKIILL
ncbi:hypothetical protein EOQ17_11570, partial [Staphylococcus pseudintermedius]|nr:hypothetical protein [Staphylococcus pseudintermedius]